MQISFFFNRSIVDLQCCVSLKGIAKEFIYICGQYYEAEFLGAETWSYGLVNTFSYLVGSGKHQGLSEWVANEITLFLSP